MNFSLSDDQKLLVDTAKGFAKKSSPVERMRKLRDSEFGFERSTYEEMGELGWLGVMFPEEVGGLGMTFVETALILTELGKTLVPEPIIESVVLGGLALHFGGTVEQQKRWLPDLCEGKKIWALGWAEAASRFDHTAVATTATRDGNGFVLRGNKAWVLGGHAADHFVVSAMLDGQLALFVVDADAENLKRTKLSTIDSRGAAALALGGVKLESACLLGGTDATGALGRVLEAGAAAACAEGVGIAKAAHAMTVEYLKTREQFGTLIGSFQVLQHRSVDMFVEVQLCESIAIEAMIRVANANDANDANDASDASEPNESSEDANERTAAVSAAMAQMARGGRHVVRDAIQLHGGIGITDEHNIGLYFKRMQALTVAFGDEAHHVNKFASLPSFSS